MEAQEPKNLSFGYSKLRREDRVVYTANRLLSVIMHTTGRTVITEQSIIKTAYDTPHSI